VNRFRRLLVRWEKKAVTDQGLPFLSYCLEDSDRRFGR
jgi:hypothetical protein